MINELNITMISPKLDISLQKKDNGNLIVRRIFYDNGRIRPYIMEFNFSKKKSEYDFIINTIIEMKKINEQSDEY